MFSCLCRCTVLSRRLRAHLRAWSQYEPHNTYKDTALAQAFARDGNRQSRHTSKGLPKSRPRHEIMCVHTDYAGAPCRSYRGHNQCGCACKGAAPTKRKCDLRDMLTLYHTWLLDNPYETISPTRLLASKNAYAQVLCEMCS